MAFCTQCGVEIQDDANFCESCGAKQESSFEQDGGQRTVNQGNGVDIKKDTPIPQVMYTLSSRVAVCATFRIIFAALQTLFIVIAYLVIGTNGKRKIFEYYWIAGTLSVGSFLLGIKDLKFAKIMLSNHPIGLKKLLYGGSGIKISGSLILGNGVLCFLSIVFVRLFFDDMTAVMVIIFGVICGLAALVSIFEFLFIHKFAKKNWEKIDEYISQFNIDEKYDEEEDDDDDN